MSNSYELLFRSIRSRCQQEHWFGPDCSNPKQYEGILAYDPHFDIRSIESVPADDPNRFGFVFPAASEELLCATEARLGFPLPPLLRALYARVANGGFGPGLGLRGILEGYGRPGASIYPNSDDTVVARYLCKNHKRTIGLAEYEGQWTARRELLLPYGYWPEQLLPICDLGCVQEACIDNKEKMFLVAPIDSDELYCLAQLPWTFEEWLWRWVRDEDLLEGYERAA
jgi:SMI1/KNR4 family protein SUKH-1